MDATMRVGIPIKRVYYLDPTPSLWPLGPKDDEELHLMLVHLAELVMDDFPDTWVFLLPKPNGDDTRDIASWIQIHWTKALEGK